MTGSICCESYPTDTQQANMVQEMSWFECWLGLSISHHFNTLRPERNGRHFADDIVKRILLRKIHIINSNFTAIFLVAQLTHWGRVTHICVSKRIIIGSNNGFSPGRRRAIIWTNTEMLFIRTLGTNFSEILSEIHSFSFSKMRLKMSSAKWRPFGLGLNEF